MSSGSFNKKLYSVVIKNNVFKNNETVPLKLNERLACIDEVKRILCNVDPIKYSNIALLDSSYLEVHQSTLTSGTDFWKGTRKIYIIDRQEYENYKAYNEELEDIQATNKTNIKRKRAKNDYDEDDDDEYETETTEDEISYSPIMTRG